MAGDLELEHRCAGIDDFCLEVVARLGAATTGFELGAIDSAVKLIETAGRIANVHLVEAGVLRERDEP